uniref:Uncharacterized protein n=2 Tax=Oryza TaxID=4527 RepID=A0A0E0P8V0_ORYRU
MTYLATSQSFQFPMIDCSRNRRVTRGVIADGGRTAAWSSRSDSEPYLVGTCSGCLPEGVSLGEGRQAQTSVKKDLRSPP